MLLGGMISIMEDVRLCEDCQFCNTIQEVSEKIIILILIILEISYFN
jgi:hypothetical protein